MNIYKFYFFLCTKIAFPNISTITPTKDNFEYKVDCLKLHVCFPLSKLHLVSSSHGELNKFTPKLVINRHLQLGMGIV